MTDLSKLQLNAVLSALHGQPRNPNTKKAAVKAIAKHAERLGLGLDDLLTAAAGLLDGRMSAEAFHSSLPDEAATRAGEPSPEQDPDNAAADDGAPVATEATDAEDGEDAPVAATAAHAAEAAESGTLGSPRQQLLAACQRAAQVLHEHQIEADTLQMLRAAIALKASSRRAGRATPARARAKAPRRRW